jgi:hypothetical protein
MITEVPFHLAGAAQPLILVPTSVNGRGPFDFILDTGAGTSLVSLDLARQLGVATEQVKEGTSAGARCAWRSARSSRWQSAKPGASRSRSA